VRPLPTDRPSRVMHIWGRRATENSSFLFPNFTAQFLCVPVRVSRLPVVNFLSPVFICLCHTHNEWFLVVSKMDNILFSPVLCNHPGYLGFSLKHSFVSQHFPPPPGPSCVEVLCQLYTTLPTPGTLMAPCKFEKEATHHRSFPGSGGGDEWAGGRWGGGEMVGGEAVGS